MNQEMWTPEEQAAFADFMKKQFPNEMDSFATMSLGSAWKDGQAHPIPPQPDHSAQFAESVIELLSLLEDDFDAIQLDDSSMPLSRKKWNEVSRQADIITKAQPLNTVQGDAQAVDDTQAFERHWYAQKSTAIGSAEGLLHFSAGAAHVRSSIKSTAIPDRKSELDVFSQYGLGHVSGWNECLKEVRKLFTHADGGEAVTQKAVADAAWAEVDKCREDSKVFIARIDTLRAQLETAKAELAELPEKLIAAIDAEQVRLSAEDYMMDSDECIKVMREYLSASAEPTKCETCGDWGHIETEDSAHDCPECGPSVIEQAVEAGVMNAPKPYAAMSEAEADEFLSSFGGGSGNKAKRRIEEIEKAKQKVCIECDQPYCHGVCVERGDEHYDRDHAVKGGDHE
ncbi:MAG: hypothetical protein ACOH2T_29305 [Pseudomonas sp.]